MELTADQFREIGRHFVSMTWFDATPTLLEANNGRPVHLFASGFIVSVQGVWFWVTAGHVIEEIEEAIRDGRTLLKFRFDDRNVGPLGHPPFDFDYKNATKFAKHWEDLGVDIAVVHLRPYYVELLKANGVVPFDESHLQAMPIPQQVQGTLLMGIPTQLTTAEMLDGKQKISFQICVVPVRLTNDVPEPLKMPTQRLIGYLDGMPADYFPNWDSVKGMSGCPWIVLSMDEKNVVSHWLAGVQSGEKLIDGKHYVTCCLFQPMGRVLAALIAGLVEET